MKIVRHGYESFSPFDEARTSNRRSLEKELGHVLFACRLLAANGDIGEDGIGAACEAKAGSVARWLHHGHEGLEPADGGPGPKP
jgi:hypothetical protein